MDKVKIAKRLVEISKELVARELTSEQAIDWETHKEIVGEAVTKLWSAFNELEVADNYLKKSQQGGMIRPFQRDYKIRELKKIIEKLDKYAG